tara:strand:- start:2527 stop:2919 length:393 start_codon:yes stop_codon:yes gene_type:complete
MNAPESARDTLFAAAAIVAAIAVGLGAYGAHRLAVEPSIVRIWETGVSYQMWHALGAIAAALLARARSGRYAIIARLAGWAFLVGAGLFASSLYWFVLNGIVPVPGAAPLGGIMMMAGWVALAVVALKGH